MKPVEKELLLILYKSQKQFQTSKELAQKLNLSERTVRTYISHLKSLVEEQGGKIEAKQGNGYRLALKHPKQFEAYLFKSRLEELKREPDVIDSSAGRRDMIISRLLLNNEKIEALDLANDLYISESTLKKELNSLKALLDVYGLKLVTQKKKLTIQGEETDKRRMILDYFFKHKKFVSLQEYMDHSGFFDEIPSESILMIILEELRQEEIHLSDMMIQNLLLHIALSIKRIQCGQDLKHFEALDTDFDPLISEVAKRIISRISELMNLQFPQSEVQYLTLHLVVKSNPNSEEVEDDCELIRTELQVALKNLADRLGVPVDQDPILERSLIEHLIPMLLRLQSGIQQQNPLTLDIKNQYSELLTVVSEELSKMPCLIPYDVSEDEWAYLAIHFLAALDRQQETKKLQVLVICATGFGSSQLLKNRLMKKFSNSIHIVNETGYYDMNDELLEGIDLIISSVNMAPIIFGVPFLHVSVFLSDDDVEKIQKYIDQNNKKNMPKPKIEAVKQINSDTLRLLQEQLPEENFFVFEGNVDRDTVVDTLVHCISRNENPHFEQKLKDQLTLRQKMGSVAFSEQIVVAHPAIALAERSSFALGLVPNGLKWDDSSMAIQYVFLMSPSYLENEDIKVMVESIIDLIDHPEIQEKILKYTDYDTFSEEFGSLLEAQMQWKEKKNERG